jgi:hypothetical protein
VARTPDSFPGQRQEEDVLFILTSSLPTQNGQVLYSSGTVSGSGFFFMEENVVKKLGLSSTEHEVEFTLVHDIVSSSYDQTTYDSQGRLSQYVVWRNSSLDRKVQQFDLQYSGSTNNLVTAMTSSQFDSTGSLRYTVTEVPTYNAQNRVTSITRTKSG